MNKFSSLAAARAAGPEKEPEKPAPAAAAVETPRMLGGRVPDSIFREFTYMKMEAEPVLQVRRVTTEEALEAMVRALRDPDVREKWLEELREVRQRRRE